MSETIGLTEVRTDDRELTVSTIKVAPGYYDTVVFDDSPERRHAGRTVGRFVIEKGNVRSETRAQAMDVHREAFLTARDEPIR